jgi:hypothetical protein
MSTRFYLPSSGSAPVTPAYDANWDNTTFAGRLPCHDSKQSTAMATVADNVNIKTNEDHLYRQWISGPITAQTLSAQTLKLQIRAAESNAAADLYASISVRVVSNDGNTVRGTILTLVRDSTEFASTLTNRGYSATTTQVVASANDRIVIEIGQGGDPTGGGNHNDGTLRIGDTAASDLPENDTATDDYNPWVQFANTISFAAAPDNLTASDITSGTPTLDQPVITRIVNLTGTDVTSGTPTLDQPVITRIVNLTGTDVTSGTPTLDQPTLAEPGGTDDLTASDITSGTPTLDQPIITRIVNLTAVDLLSAALLFDSPIFDAYTNTPSARTSTPILATLSSTPPTAQRISVPY